jgi:hypothetical protein
MIDELHKVVQNDSHGKVVRNAIEGNAYDKRDKKARGKKVAMIKDKVQPIEKPQLKQR